MAEKLTEHQRVFGKYAKASTIAKIKSFIESKTDGDWYENFKKNPYMLMDFRGFSFVKCDDYAQKLGVDINSPLRFFSCMAHIMKNDTNGSVIISIRDAVNLVQKYTETEKPSEIFKSGFENKKDNFMFSKFVFLGEDLKETEVFREVRHIALDEYRKLERRWLNTIKKTGDSWKRKSCTKFCTTTQIQECEGKCDKLTNYIAEVVETVESNLKFPLNEKQKKALSEIPQNKINVLTGIAGVGKTYTTKAVLNVLDKLGETYTILTPTGASSKVIKNAVGREAMTIHKHFFSKNSIGDWLIIDETSMVGLDHLQMIINQIDKCNILLLGDTGQLESISIGALLRDTIKLLQFKYVRGSVQELTDIMRVKDGLEISTLTKMFTKYGRYNPDIIDTPLKGVEFIGIDKENINLQLQDVVERKGFKLEDTYFLTPKRSGVGGVDEINNFIQNKFNHSEVLYKNKIKEYRTNDILMHVVNNKDLQIFNGERVVLRSVAETPCGKRYTCDRLDDEGQIVYDEETLMLETVLSYATTVHKSQGMSIKNVVCIISNSHTFMLSRNAVYTAMSRASENLILIYDKKTFSASNRKVQEYQRSTFIGVLIERIKNKK
jgi:RecD/TraA family predicted helicase